MIGTTKYFAKIVDKISTIFDLVPIFDGLMKKYLLFDIAIFVAGSN